MTDKIYVIIGYTSPPHIINVGMTEDEARFSARVQQWISDNPNSKMSVIVINYKHLEDSLKS